MGRLPVQERWIAAVLFAVLHPGLLGLSGWVTDEFGRPAVSLTAGLAVVFFLSVGTWGLVPAGIVRVGLVAIGGGGPAALVVVLIETLVWFGVARLLEWSADRNGPVRTTDLIAEFLLIAVLGGPLVAVTIGAWVQGAAFDPSAALGPANGILVLVAGLRVLSMRKLPHFSGRAVALTFTGVIVYVAAVGLTVRLVDPTTLATQSVAVVYLVATAFLLGFDRYTALLSVGTLLGLTAMALVNTGVYNVSVPLLVGGTGALAVGLLAATESDRRKDSTAELEVLFAAATTPAAVVRLPDLEVDRTNPALDGLIGPSQVDEPLDEVLHLGGRARAAMEQLVRSDGEVELWFRDHVGAWRFGRLSLTRIRRARPGGDVALVQLVDLTEVQQRAAALERANAALNRLSGRVAHDLRQPLAAIVAFASTIDEHVDQLSPEMLREMTGRLGAAANRAADRLESLAESARAAGEGPVTVGLAATLDGVEETLALEMADRAARLDRDLEVATVVGDRGAVSGVLLNLVGNSLKYADPDKAPVVQVRSRAVDGGVLVTVEDDGPGIPVDRLASVFARGVRLDVADVPGTGMGLTDSKDLAEASGGSLESIPTVDGARFDLWLPGEVDVEGVPLSLRVLHADGDARRRERVVRLIELDARLRHVGNVGSADAVVSAVRHAVPDVLLLSSDFDGVAELRALLSAQLPGLRVMVVTSEELPRAVARLAAIARERGRTVAEPPVDVDDVPTAARSLARDG